MSTIYKSNIYIHKARLLVECAKAMRYRSSKDQFILGGIVTIVTELLFVTYYVDDMTSEDYIYSDAKVVAARVPDEYADIALDVVTFRNAFAHEFGTVYYDELYESIIDRIKPLTEFVHRIGGMPNKAEKEFLLEYLK